MTVQFLGPDFIVNTTTLNGQSEPSVAALSDGRFVVTWADVSGTDGSGTAIRGRIYDATGTATGADFIVNTTTANFQSDPSIAALSDGRFIVTWQDNSGTAPDTSGSAIRGRVYDASGTATGADFIVNTTTTGFQSQPSVATLPDGRFVVTWTDESSTAPDTSVSAIRGRVYDASGTATGADFIVNTTTLNLQFEPGVAALSDGRFVVTWTDLSGTAPDTSGTAIRGRIYDANGTATGADFIVNTTTANSQIEPSIAALSDGRFVVTWTDQSGASPATIAIRGRVYDANGTATSADFIVNTTSGGQQQPSIAALSDGRFVVTWTDSSGTDGSGSGIRGRVYEANGTATGPDFSVNTTTLNSQSQPSVAALSDGRFVVTWRDDSGTDGSGSGIRAAMFEIPPPNTAPSGTNGTLSTFEDTPYTFTPADFGFIDGDAGDTLQAVRIDTLPTAGMLELNSTPVTVGQVIAASHIAGLTFTPAANANGNGYASLTFSVSDGTAFDATPNSLTFNVTPVNDAPVLIADRADVTEGLVASVSGNVLNNDTDIDSQTLSIVRVDGAGGVRFDLPAVLQGFYGTLSIAADGAYTYTLDPARTQGLTPDTLATDTFSYSVTDGPGATAETSSTLTIEVNGTTPTVVADAASITEGVTATISGNVLANDTAVGMGVLSIVRVDGAGGVRFDLPAELQGFYGTLSIAADGSYSYAYDAVRAGDLAPGDTRQDSFDYFVTDGPGSVAEASATLTITITGVADNTPPVITSGGGLAAAALSIAENTSLVTVLAATDADVPAQTLTFSIAGGEDAALFEIRNGTELHFNAAPDFEALPDAGPTPGYQVEVQVSDGNGGADSQLISATVVDVDDSFPMVAITWIEPGNESFNQIDGGNDLIGAMEARGGITISGTASVGSALLVNGIAVSVDDAGVWTATIPTPPVDGPLQITAVASNAAGLAATATRTLIVDTTADEGPFLEVAVPDDTINGSQKSAVSFVVSGLDADAVGFVRFTNGVGQSVLVNVAEDGVGVADLTSLNDGLVTVTIANTDAAGNIALGQRTNLVIDTVAPAVTSFVLNGSATTNAASVSYTVTFSEAVAGVDTRNFSVSTTGLAGTAVIGVTEVAGSNGAQYEVLVNSGIGDGEISLSFSNGGVSDLAGNQIDGTLDILIANTNSSSIQFLSGNGDGTFASQGFLSSVDSAPIGFASGDLDGDGDTDVVSANIGSRTISVFTQGTGGGFAGGVEYATGGTPNASVARISLGDIDNDGDLDAVVANFDSSTIGVLKGRGDGTFEAATTVAVGGAQPTNAALGDIDGDGDLDMVTANFDTASVSVLRNDGSGDFTLEASLTSGGNNPNAVSLADMDADGALDIVVANRTSNTVAVLYGSGNGSFQAAQIVGAGGRNTEHISVGDINGDRYLDVVTANFGSSQIGVLLGGPGRTLTASQTVFAPGPVYVQLADITGDGNADILTANFGGANVSVFEGSGTGTFTSLPSISGGGGGTRAVIAGDFTGPPSTLSAGPVTIDRTAPEIALDVAAVDENTSVGTLVGVLNPVGADAGSAVSYELIDDAGGLFTLGGDLGDEILVGGGLDFEAAAGHTITVRVTDALGNSADRTLAIGVNDVNEAPSDLALSAFTVDEGAVAGTVVGTLSALDPDAGDALTYTLDDDSGGLFELVGTEIRVTDSSLLDFELATSHVISVTATDAAGLAISQSFEIAVADVNEAPDTLVVVGDVVEENAAQGTLVASVEATDPDAGDTVSYSLADDAGGRFEIIGSDILVASGADLNFEALSSHDITVIATDTGGLERFLTVTINVADVNEAPEALALDGQAVLENSAAGTLVGTLSATDPDSGDLLTFALADDAGGLFEIVDNEVRVAAGAVLDFETATSHDIVVDVSDAGGLSQTQTFTIAIGNERPTIIGTNAANTLIGGDEDEIIFGRGGNDSLFGFANSDELYGEAGNDTLDGGEGADLLVGGADNDTYIVDDLLDTIVEAAGAGTGTDTVVTSLAAFSLAGIANVENLTAVGGGDFVGTGNELANTITGGIGNDTIDGGIGNDRLVGGLGDDVYIVDSAGDVVTEALNAGTDRIETALATYSLATLTNVENLRYTGAAAFSGTGNARSNVITGGAAADTLNGGTGVDTLIGGLGDDTYFVDNVGDVVIEAFGEGVDTVNSSVSYVLGDNVERLLLTGNGSISGTGNAATNIITGNGGANTLDGGAGDDQLIGGLGNDTYVIDSLGDVLVEVAGQGTDLARTALSNYSLESVANVENLTFTGVGDFTGTGNVLANTITGGAGNDALDGGVGNDRLIGGSGNDSYFVDSALDVVVEAASAGIDTVYATGASYTLGSNVEDLFFFGSGNFSGTGNGLANVITGGDGADTLNGAGGNDTLIGGGGNDVMNGGSGNDTFVFAAGFGNDTITSFDANPQGGQDFLDLTAFGITSATFAARVDIDNQPGQSVLVTIDGTDTITLTNLSGTGTSTINQFDFII
ncbi:MAG: hypothetical protein CK429_35370 [Mycobacterium sp.]|nr:MAG: hypothetical protein CK429_35370 [Mycobacterium sp.]